MADPFAPLVNDLRAENEFATQAFARAKRHSRLVRLLKFALPVVAVVIIAGFSLVALQVRMVPDVNVGNLALESGKIVMDNPKLNGVTGNNQPYRVEAIRALQSVGNVNDIELEGVTAEIPFSSTATAKVLAPVGHLNNTTQILTLGGGFHLTTSDGMVAKLQDAVFDFSARSLKTTKPVDITRPGTHIQADSMTIINGGASLVFEKRVRMVLQPALIEPGKETENGG